MPAELRPILRLASLERSRSAESVLYTGVLGRSAIVATTTGIGIRAAARTAERMLDAFEIDHLVVVGIAGGVGPSVAIGDLVVPERVLDLACGRDHRPSQLGGIAPRGILATSDRLIVDPNEIADCARRGVVAIDMETAAIAAVCERRGCPWSVFRGISDRADDGSTDEAVLGLASPDGSPDLLAVARFVLTRPWRIPQLVRLGRGMQRAAQAAAVAAVRAIEGS